MKRILRAGQWRTHNDAQRLMAVRSTRGGQRIISDFDADRQREMDEPQDISIQALVAASQAQRQAQRRVWSVR